MANGDSLPKPPRQQTNSRSKDQVNHIAPSTTRRIEHGTRAPLAPYLEDLEESVGANVSVVHLAKSSSASQF
jgi:hypothetical protein